MKKLVILLVGLNLLLTGALILVLSEKRNVEKTLIEAARKCDPSFGEK